MRKIAALAAAAIFLVASGARAKAEEPGFEDMFSSPSEEAKNQGSPGNSVLNEVKARQSLVSSGWNIKAAGGASAGLSTLEGFNGFPQTLQKQFGAAFTLSNTLDLRPNEYIRLHEASSVSYPDSNYAIAASWFNELYIDYALSNGMAVKFGKFGVSWGNARILEVANLPGRTTNEGNLDPTAIYAPSWTQKASPALWTKAILPLGSYTATGLVSLPSDAKYVHPRYFAYGLFNELTLGKTYLTLGGLYQEGKTPRLTAGIKSSAFGVDLFVDGSLAFYGDALLPAIVGGLYYQTSAGPDVKLTAELRWNGESSIANKGYCSDALTLGGLSQAIALAWSNLGGSGVTVGGTWYHDWSDGSGAVAPSFSMTVAPNLNFKGTMPFVYGSASGHYVLNKPSETSGYALGSVFSLVLSVDL